MASAGEDMSRPIPTPFLIKTYQLVDDRDVDGIISWNADGSAFIVWNPADFARDLLPKYFKHNNFSSFVRQLNTYGFRKVVPDRWEFSNECFRRGEKQLLRDIQRRKMAAKISTSEEQVISSSNFSAVELIDENERLRRQNVELRRELGEMKNLCDGIYALLSNYGGGRCEEGVRACKLYMTENLKALELLPSTRFCGAAEGTSAEDEMDLELRLPGGDAKHEPFDGGEYV
ncbi:heat stress transcription factor B-2a-like [Salvia splendens]|uniref:heat stress transcription factor B-2a-like n=1 Tax=Salvia splendens TaxID=180675 RepID=UPI001C2788D2|nr:heat stress transcription factor B-2a-like [Salvia splendens]